MYQSKMTKFLWLGLLQLMLCCFLMQSMQVCAQQLESSVQTVVPPQQPINAAVVSQFDPIIPVDRVVAIVNSNVITMKQLQDRLLQVEDQLKEQGEEMPGLKALKKQVLDRLIIEEIQVQRAEEMGLDVEQSELMHAVETIAKNNKVAIEQLKAQLEHDGISWDYFVNEIHKQLIMDKLRSRVIDTQINVSQAEVDNFIANNPDVFSGKELLAAHIVVRLSADANAQEAQKAEAKMQTIMHNLQSGQSFRKVATEYSESPDAVEGGVLGWKRLDQLPPLYSETLSKMHVGEISPVFRSAMGLHILMLAKERDSQQAQKTEIMQTHVRHILIKTSEVMSDEAAQSRLNAIRERILNGEDFTELARTNSSDLSAANGGDIGWVNPGDTVPEFEQIMNRMDVMQVSEPFKSQFGWHILQVLERRNQDVTELQKKVQVRRSLFKRKSDMEYFDWLNQLRDEAYVKTYLEDE